MEVFVVRYKGVLWIMHHLRRFPGASLANLALWWSRTTNWLTEERPQRKLLSFY